jgi:hypothetical protein
VPVLVLMAFDTTSMGSRHPSHGVDCRVYSVAVQARAWMAPRDPWRRMMDLRLAEVHPDTLDERSHSLDGSSMRAAAAARRPYPRWNRASVHDPSRWYHGRSMKHDETMDTGLCGHASPVVAAGQGRHGGT